MRMHTKLKLHVFEYILVNGRQHKWVTPSDSKKKYKRLKYIPV